MKKMLCVLLILAAVLLCFGGAGADPDLTLRDTAVRSGAWAETYVRILEDRSAGIRAYREYAAEVSDMTDCRPVGLTDLTGDGIPELIFLDLMTETEYGFRVGRLWIYSGNGKEVRCLLSLQPEIDDLMYSSVYQGKNGALTLYFNDCEMRWQIRLMPGRNGVYGAQTVLHDQEDFSGEGPDTYWRNGKRISKSAYQSALKKLKADRGTLLGSVNPETGENGFTMTEGEARQALTSGGVINAAGNAGTGGEKELYGLAMKKLATREGPGTQYRETGTYSVKGQQIRILARAWDDRNGTWWVKCEIPYKGKIRVLWTGYSRFDSASLALEDIPVEIP